MNATAHCEKDSHCEKELCFLKACYVLEHCALVLIEKEREKQCDSVLNETDCCAKDSLYLELKLSATEQSKLVNCNSERYALD